MEMRSDGTCSILNDDCPENCCWITKIEQAKNQRPRKKLCNRDEKGRFVKSA